MNDLPSFISLLKQHANSPPSLRKLFNLAGVHLLPAGYHSAIPSVAQIEASFEYDGSIPFPDDSLFDHAHLATFLSSLQPFSSEFAPKIEGNRRSPDAFFWDNPMFSGCDALAYYSILRLLKPRHILEIGSGFSTLVALQAVAKNGFGHVTCIEPYPRDFLKHLAPNHLHLIQQPAQSIPFAHYDQLLHDGDILFIDSTHTVNTGNDCVHLYLRVLPKLQSRLTVHVHDVFLPMSYPKQWLLDRQEYWTEQYLLHAWLLDNPRTRVCFGATYHQLVNPQPLAQFMAGKFGVGGSSFWFQITAPPTPPSQSQFANLHQNLAAYNASASSSPIQLKTSTPTPPPPTRPPRDARQIIPAVDYDAQRGAINAQHRLESLDDGDWIQYAQLDFGAGPTTFLAHIAVPPKNAGQRIEIRLDALDGPLIGTLTVSPTAGWEDFQTQSTPITPPPQGVHHLFLVFRGYYGAGNLAWIRFA